MSPQRFQIVKDPQNPSVADVIDAFARAYDPSPRMLPVTLSYALATDLRKAELQITGLDYESGKPGMFLISGYLFQHGENEGTVKGYYNARQRVGHISFTSI